MIEFNPYLHRDNRPLRERGSRYTPDASDPDGCQKRPPIDERVFRNYLAALALLGRVSEAVPRDDLSERMSLEQAFIDANEVLRRKGADFYFEKNSRGGYSMFDGSPLPPR
jgi:hypothetical protein